MVCCGLPSSGQTYVPSPHVQGQQPSLGAVGGGTAVQWLELLELDRLELELERLELELELDRLELELERLELELTLELLETLELELDWLDALELLEMEDDELELDMQRAFHFESHASNPAPCVATPNKKPTLPLRHNPVKKY